MSKLKIHSHIFDSKLSYTVILDSPNNNELTLEVDLEDFIKLVHSKLRHPVKLWTKAQQDYDFETAIAEALLEIKRSTIYG